MNVERLKAVRDSILADPEHYNQQILFQSTNACSTEACIAGRAILMFDKDGKQKKIKWLEYLDDLGKHVHYITMPFRPFEVASDILDLTDDEQERLFNEIDLEAAQDADEDYLGWPLQFAEQYMNAKTGAERVKIAADRIDFFIATNGTDDLAVQGPVVK